MWTRVLLAASLLCVICSSGPALELKNVRPSYGPIGATRTDVKCLPKDTLFINYDIDGLKFDAKTGKARYTTILELIDGSNKVIYRKDTPNEVIPQLGGTRMPGDLFVVMGRDQKPGKYSVRLTVDDKLA